MKYYIGIDLGTTNSSICSYDGVNAPRIWKSPEQNDVTPSVIYINKRGSKVYGYRAYNQAAHDLDNSAKLFKRSIGTGTKFDFKDCGLSLTPESCSAEILKILFGYLPDEIRNDPEIATVITVPAAFNQVKKQATLEAAKMAGIGRAALMQEPVAAVMSVMRLKDNLNGIFLIYDLGGGTFDISIAESVNGKVNLLATDGKEMCGGRDWDRKIFDNIVRPWLEDNFNLPEDFIIDINYKKLRGAAMFAIEQAKIELSLKNSAVIQADDTGCQDLNGEDIYLEVPISRNVLNPLIDNILDETIEITRAAMKKAGLSSSDIEKLIFIGGPTNYSYLRDKVSAELAVSYDTDVNPMTAVAEGASIFAESIDWTSEYHNRKPVNADINIFKDLNFRYEARVTGDKARIICRVNTAEKLQIEITSDDTGWTLGRFDLTDGKIIELPLNAKSSENTFTVNIYDNLGRKIQIPVNKIVITKTLASVGAIPASHSISITALNKLGGGEGLVYLVKKDETLPKTGRVEFKAAQTLRANTYESLNFNIWEGEIETPYYDNRFIGVYKISGEDLAGGSVIPIGSEIICDYEISDSGVLSMTASVPCLGKDRSDFGRKNFYYHDDAKLDLNDTSKLAADGREIIERIGELEGKIDDDRLDKAKAKAERAAIICSNDFQDPEEVQETYNELYEAKKILSQINKEHAKEINQFELDNCTGYFKNYVEKYAERSEIMNFNNAARTAQRYISDLSFKHYLDDLWSKIFVILVRQDWFVVEQFNSAVQNPDDYYDLNLFAKLKESGENFVRQGNIDGLRAVMNEFWKIRRNKRSDKRLSVNIIKG